MKIGITDNPDTFKFDNNNKFECIFFKYGFIISTTDFRAHTIDIYDYKTDSIVKGQGVKRISHTFKFRNKFPYIYRDNTLKQNIPLSLL